MQEFNVLETEVRRVKALPEFQFAHDAPNYFMNFRVHDKGYKSTKGEFFDDEPLFFIEKFLVKDEEIAQHHYYPIKRVGHDAEEGIVYFVVLSEGKEVGHLKHPQVKKLFDDMLRKSFPEYYEDSPKKD